LLVEDRLGDVLHHDGLAGFRRCYEQTALAFADRCDQIHDPAGQILGAACALLEGEALVRKQRREVFEEHLALGILGLVEIDFTDLE
jgi:hypothetical protein